MAASHDLFFSYRRRDLDRAQPLLHALAEAGVRVWRDENDIPEQASITAEIRHAIANSKALLAFYSFTYPLSNPCQQEITIAWLAAQQIDQISNRRVWVVNPEDSFEHIPELLRDQQIPSLPGDGAQFAAIAQGIRNRLDALDTTLLGCGMRDLSAYHGMSAIQARSFFGRAKEFWELHGKLTANRISIITGEYGHAAAQIRGLGGNGKSLLAREYSIRFGPAYPGGVFWLNAYGHDDTKGFVNPDQREALRQDQIREFAIRSGVSTDDLKPGEIETRFWQAIEKRDKRCLWIVDDVPSGLRSNELESTWNARWPGASTLVTTRSKEYGALGNTLDLGVLSSGEALALLYSHRKAANNAEESAARRIVDLLGCHPLAVEVAGSYLAQGVEGFESYLDAVVNPLEDAVEFGALLKESLPTGHERSISATLLKSIQQLGSEGLDFLWLASVLAVAPIQVSFISEVFEFLDGGGLGDQGKLRALKAVDQAVALSLCERSGDDARAVHTLVSRTMFFEFPADKRTHDQRSAAVQVLTRRLELVGDIREHAKIAMDVPHARHLVTNDLQTKEEATLALLVARRDYARGEYGSARKLQEQVLEARRRVLGEDHPDTLMAVNDLAAILHAQGEAAGARKLQELVLAESRRVLGEEHPETLRAKNNFAQTLYAQRDLGGARGLQEQVLAARRRVLGAEHPDTLTAMNNLAGTLYAQGDLVGARELQQKALAVSRPVLGAEHRNTLGAIDNLALTLHAQGDLAGARRLQEQVLSTRRRVLGAGHPDTLASMNNLAQTLKVQGDLPGARKLQEEVLEASRRVLGEGHPNTLIAMNNLAEMTN